MRLFPNLFLAVSLSACSTVPAVFGQTNLSATFQGFRPGDIVRLKVDRPLTVLGRALFQSETSSNAVFLSKGDRYVFDKSVIVLSTPEDLRALSGTLPATAQTAGVPPLASVPDSTLNQQEAQMLMLGIQQKILGNYTGDKGYGEASKYYQETMKGFLQGQVNLGDIVRQAEQTLQKVDQYQAERSKDPQFEGQIQYLKSFLDRAKAGETFQQARRVE